MTGSRKYFRNPGFFCGKYNEKYFQEYYEATARVSHVDLPPKKKAVPIKVRQLFFFNSFLVARFFDTGLLSFELSQVEDPGTTHPSAFVDGNVFNERGGDRKNSFHSDVP